MSRAKNGIIPFMSFAYPLAFVALAPLLFAAWRLFRRGRRGGIRFSAFGRLPPASAGWRARVAAFAPVLLVAGLLLLVFALARPRRPLAHGTRTVDAIAIVMAVDVSGSMEALDLTPKGESFSKETTRLAIVKRLFAQFVERRPDDLIGLVTFGGYAATRAPLTADHEALLHVLKGVEVPAIAFDAQGQAISGDEQMTAVGDGLATALARLKEAGLKSKIVILLSDGVSNTGAVEPEEAAEAAQKMGVKVYAIGVGTASRQTPFMGRTIFGRPAIQYADTTFDEKQLKAIAKTTGGRYFAVNDKAALEKALDEISTLETTTIESDVYDRWTEFFPPLLAAGSLFVFLAVTLSMASARRLA